MDTMDMNKVPDTMEEDTTVECTCPSCVRFQKAIQEEKWAEAEYDYAYALIRFARDGLPCALNIDVPDLEEAHRWEEEARKVLLRARTRVDYYQGIAELAHSG